MDWDEVMAFYFEANLAGWAAGGKKIVIPDMPGFKAIRYRRDDFSFLDCYSVTPDSSMSVGTTTIWRDEKPVWFMRYEGFYVERAIALLKRALIIAYEARQFFGGRGQFAYMEEGSLIYENRPCPNYFWNFGGCEQITDTDSMTVLGWHEYRGFSLIRQAT